MEETINENLIYFGLVEDDYGFVSADDPRKTDDFIDISEEYHQQLLDEQSTGKEIVFYEGEVFTAEPGRYYVDENAVWQKRTDKEYEEFLKELENEHIGSLTMTKRVFALILKEYGISYAQLKELIATNDDAQLEWDLCGELQRNNPLLDVMGAQLGVTPEQLDEMFKYANGEITQLSKGDNEVIG